MKPTRIVVTRGVSVSHATGETWDQVKYEVEMALEDPNEIQVAKAELTGLIQGWLAVETLAAPALVATKVTADVGELNGLSWKSYQTKEACKPGEAGWIFSNAQGAERLIDMLHEAPSAPVVTPSYEYRLSGDKGQFIQRKPVKKA